jgi:hypothetical protein
MDGRQDRAEHLAGHEEVSQVRSAEAAARKTVTPFLDRTLVAPMSGVAQLDVSGSCETGRVSAISGGHDAVEQVDAGSDRVEQVLWPANAHQVSRTVRRQEMSGHGEGLANFVATFADAHTAHGVAIEIQGQDLLGASGA